MYITQGVHRSAQINGDGIATSFNGRRRSWREFADRVARLAGGLRSLGVAEGDRVAILAHGSDRYIEYYYAVLWLGAVVSPVNTRWSRAEILYSLDDSTPSVLLFDDAFLEQAMGLRGEARSLRHLVYVGDADAPGGCVSYEQLIAQAAPVEDRRCGGASLAAIMYTGGTTGFPKGVMLSHDGIMASTMMMATILKPSQTDVTLHAAPMFHLAAAGMMFSATLFGGTNVVVPAFAPAQVSEVITSERVNTILLVPTMLKMLLDHRDAHGGDLSSIRTLVYGASPMSEPVLLRAIKALPGVRLIHAYGQTELSPGISMLEPAFHVLEGPAAGRIRSAGRSLPGLDVKIAAEDGRELARGEVGEVWVLGQNAMLGYWNKPEATAATLVDGWVRTGDAAYMDEGGFLFIVDRLKDMIISGGENVFSAEVENAVMQHPDVADCAVIGVPDEQWGERVHAIVVPRAGRDVTLEMIGVHCRALIAGYKCPRSIDLRSEPLPLSAAGKVLKADLRAPYWTGERAI